MFNLTGQLALAAVILVITIFLVLLLPGGARANESAEQPLDDPAPAAAVVSDPRIEQVTDHIRSFLLTVCGKAQRQPCLDKVSRTRRWRRAPVLAGLIVEAADEHEVDPLVVSEIARSECSYYEGRACRTGDLGEYGIGQLMPGGRAERAARTAGYDLTTTRGQLRAIALTYADCYAECGDELGALRRYQTGRCRASSAKGPQVRFKRLKRARARLTLAD